MEIPSRLQDWLVHSATPCGNADNGTALSLNGLPGTGGQTDPGFLAIVGMAHNHAGAPRGTGEPPTISHFLFAHGNHCALRHLSKRQAIPDSKLRLGPTIHELTGVKTLDRNPTFFVQPVPVWVTKFHLAHRSTTAGIVHDLRDEALDEPIALSVV